MLQSEAWRQLTINARRLIDFLMLEHMAHAGTENGNLKAPYSQLVAFGMSRRLIKAAIDHVQRLGFVDVVRGGRILSEDKASLYRLTWLPTRDGEPATNRWKFVSTMLEKNQIASTTSGTVEGSKECHI